MYMYVRGEWSCICMLGVSVMYMYVRGECHVYICMLGYPFCLFL
jgi:hypothetical protein